MKVRLLYRIFNVICRVLDFIEPRDRMEARNRWEEASARTTSARERKRP